MFKMLVLEIFDTDLLRYIPLLFSLLVIALGIFIFIHYVVKAEKKEYFLDVLYMLLLSIAFVFIGIVGLVTFIL
jgi:uncharacterized membrane protein YoaK (UPF0700 family)